MKKFKRMIQKICTLIALIEVIFAYTTKGRFVFAVEENSADELKTTEVEQVNKDTLENQEFQMEKIENLFEIEDKKTAFNNDKTEEFKQIKDKNAEENSIDEQETNQQKLDECNKDNGTTTPINNSFKDSTNIQEVQDSLGDVNDDGRISVIDCAIILAHIKGTKTLEEKEVNNADVSRDGNISIADCSLLLSQIKGIQTKGSLGWPLSTRYCSYSYITSYFGRRAQPTPGASTNHGAIDIGVSYQPVYASEDGVVVAASYWSGYGNFIMIWHKDRGELYTCYGHLSSFNVSVGSTVLRGQQIATSGNTGISTGPHLHFEVRIGGNGSGNRVDPLAYLSIG